MNKNKSIESQAVNNDIDDLNVDIAKAALKIIQGSKNIYCELYQNKLANFWKFDLSKLENSLIKRPPCRFEVIEYGINTKLPGVGDKQTVKVVLDIAHNEDAVSTLINKLKLKFPNEKFRYYLIFIINSFYYYSLLCNIIM